ncbi:alpha-phosphoglucomutase PgcA [Gottschalkia acidurici 9a]|uniref:Phosphoglucomutase n=1 Tax=Gottschalkia acidurici (strain ATCC 7906 / DSM 604 / BCRC 14475 / CIP 104303 / KCTC 5404 / NCIMB 10678 / 9a) TaxID=1128398 RepID=K0AY29_GOTA9|nr:phospho-sugar mutase [Gottschalkia acidurici]AFS77301.1 alpha-phosphoglucomutase PgcA [Gottschalkia acidurici 9a]
MSFLEKYNQWIKDESIDEETRKELETIKNDQAEIEDRFYKDLEFGTGGLRGIVGAGTNRMNRYTVARATQGLADYLKENSKGKPLSAVIAYDCRNKSDEFAKISALVLGGNNIKTYLFESLRPTPELSFAIRHLKADTGIVITASHNPPKYNGYKAYGSDGAQLPPKEADIVVEKAKQVGSIENVKMIDEQEARIKNLLSIIGSEIDDVYIDKVKKQSLREDIDKDINIVYTPLHGAGNVPVRRVLREVGFKNVHVVEEQSKPDPDFSTVSYPNPEDPKSFELSIELGKKVDADILVATDPDSDRIGIVSKNNDGDYTLISGNDTGALLLDYVLSGKKEKGILSKNGIVVKTIVTSEIGRKVAEYYELETIDTLTGFKFIAGKIRDFEREGNFTYEFGYEESFGYLPWTEARDKDGVLSTMLACEMAAYHKKQGKTLLEALEEIYKKVGYFTDDSYSIVLEGVEGKAKIEKIMDSFRNEYSKKIKDSNLLQVSDYKEGTVTTLATGKIEDTNLHRENVMKYVFDNESWYALRPSGTEPKLKVYISAMGTSMEESKLKVEAIREVINNKMENLI